MYVQIRVADPGGVDPDPTFKKNPDPTSNPDQTLFQPNTICKAVDPVGVGHKTEFGTAILIKTSVM